MEKKNSGLLTRQLTITAILLALCIVSQFLKSLSVYITGPIVNLCIILAVMAAGLMWGILLSLVTPVTAFLIAASPVMNAVPGIIPLIMLGNVSLAVMVHFAFKPSVTGGRPLVSVRSVAMAVLSCVVKAAVMGLTISLWLLPTFIPSESPLRGKMSVFQFTFSVTQLITAVIGFVYFYIVWSPLRKALSLQQDG